MIAEKSARRSFPSAKPWEDIGFSPSLYLVPQNLKFLSQPAESCINDHTHVVNGDAGFGDVGGQNDLSHSTRWFLKDQPQDGAHSGNTSPQRVSDCETVQSNDDMMT